MGIFKELGASIGIGNLNVYIETPGRSCLGEPLQGTLTIEGGKVEQVVQGLTLGVDLVWESRDEDGDRQYHYSNKFKQPIAFSATVIPGQRYSVPFAVTLPPSFELALRNHWHEVYGKADIVGGVDVSGRSKVRFLPPRPLASVLLSVEEASGWRLSDFDNKRAPDGYVRAIFSPHGGAMKRFDRMLLDIAQNGPAMQVGVTLDLKEGIWKALTKQDEKYYAFMAYDMNGLLGELSAFVNRWSAEGE